MCVLTKAAVLCGGEGNRLRPLTNYFQKTMIPVGPRRRPLLEYVVRLFVHNGVEDIILLSGYRSDEITNYFGDGSRFGANIRYSTDRPGTKGSVPAVVNAIRTNTVGKLDDLLLYNGDVLSVLDVRRLLREHTSSHADFRSSSRPTAPCPWGSRRRSAEWSRSSGRSPSSVSTSRPGAWRYESCIPVLLSTADDGGTDVMSHFVPNVLDAKMAVRPFYLEGFWYDVGTTEAYEKLDDDTVERNLKFLG